MVTETNELDANFDKMQEVLRIEMGDGFENATPYLNQEIKRYSHDTTNTRCWNLCVVWGESRRCEAAIGSCFEEALNRLVANIREYKACPHCGIMKQ